MTTDGMACRQTERRDPILMNRHTHSPADVCRRRCPGYDDMLRDKTAARFGLPRAQNARGEWVPVPPEPLFVGFRFRRARCSCGETFRNRRAYRGHYALAHILGLEAGR